MQQTSLVPNGTLRKFLAEATETYYRSLKNSPDAVEYLKSRNLSGDSAQYFRLGIVADPLPGHEAYRGRLAIPYLTRSGVVAIRYRAIPPDPSPAKYLSPPGDMPRLFNVRDLDRRELYICVTEGEMDCITAHQAGLPAVGVPGINAWSAWWARCLKGYAVVYVLADNDDKGQGAGFAEKVAEQVDNARVVMMPVGHDVNSFVCEYGPEALREMLEVDE